MLHVQLHCIKVQLLGFHNCHSISILAMAHKVLAMFCELKLPEKSPMVSPNQVQISWLSIEGLQCILSLMLAAMCTPLECVMQGTNFDFLM